MYGKKVKLRILFLSFIFLTIILTIFLVLKSLEENVVYFVSPTEIKNLAELDKKKVRVGGMVKEGSIQTSSNQISFIITDFKHEINVSFSGAVPNLFALTTKESAIVIFSTVSIGENFLSLIIILTTKFADIHFLQ